METMPGYAEPFPPPPPPPPEQKSRKGLWIGLGIAVAVLCLCCLVIGVVAALNWTTVTNFFYTRTAQSYSNPDAGISLYYPQGWQFDETGDATYGYEVIFASSTENLNSPTGVPQTGAEMIVLTNWLLASDLSFTVDASSMGDVVDYFATDIFTDTVQGQNIHTFTLSGYPAASGVYMGTINTGSTAGDPSAVYITTILRGDEIVLFIGVCPQTEWSQHQSTFDSMLNSMSIIIP
jgi:hypothetical protein